MKDKIMQIFSIDRYGSFCGLSESGALYYEEAGQWVKWMDSPEIECKHEYVPISRDGIGQGICQKCGNIP